MRLIADGSTAPSADQISSLVSLGVQGLCCYIGGPTAASSGYTSAWVAEATSINGIQGLLPTYAGGGWGRPLGISLGEDDAADAIACAERFGFQPGLIALDIERSTWDRVSHDNVIAYARAWAYRCYENEWIPVIYGAVEMISALGGYDDQGRYVFAHYWGASWVCNANEWLQGSRTLEFSWRDYDTWQFAAGGHLDDGYEFDLNATVTDEWSLQAVMPTLSRDLRSASVDAMDAVTSLDASRHEDGYRSLRELQGELATVGGIPSDPRQLCEVLPTIKPLIVAALPLVSGIPLYGKTIATVLQLLLPLAEDLCKISGAVAPQHPAVASGP